MLSLPDDQFVTIELVHDPGAQVALGTGLSHFVIKVESIDATIRALAAAAIEVEAPVSPNDSSDFWTAWIVDPDGNRIELVQWPPGHPEGMTAGDFADDDRDT
jgi:lactoylglutathione lyase